MTRGFMIYTGHLILWCDELDM